MVVIYCIEDINDLKYVGSTKQNIERRLSEHRTHQRRNNNCSSSKLNLYNCIIYQLEECEELERKERERYWINKIDCVNTRKLNGRDMIKRTEYEKQYKKQYNKQYYHKNKDKIKQDRIKNKDKIKEYNKEYQKQYYLKNKK